ncbi:MAG: hypothetical protein ACT4NY_29700 [Pseudonocardiales bacterium]
MTRDGRELRVREVHTDDAAAQTLLTYKDPPVHAASESKPETETTVGDADALRAGRCSPEQTQAASALVKLSMVTTARVWDATSGLPVGFTIVTLPGRELAVFDAIADQLVRASAGAWRWLGWNVVEDGRLTRLPAESFGPLPPLHPAT